MTCTRRTIVTALLVLPVLSACGTPGAPQPPSLHLAKPPSDLTASRSGNQVTFTWTSPRLTTDEEVFGKAGQTKMCREAQDRCAELASLATEAGGKKQSATYAISPVESTSAAGTYAVEVENSRGRSAGLSNRVEVPMAATSTLSGTPQAHLTADAVVFYVALASANPDLPQAVQLRRTAKASRAAELVVKESPLSGATHIELRDETFEWESEYTYRVAVVGREKLASGEVAFDGAVSPPIKVATHDTFPPAVPSGLQAVFSGSFAGQKPSIDLSWNPNTERDLAGYVVYRRAADQSASATVKLNDKAIQSPAFSDAVMQPGTTYVYSVSAVDIRGNESAKSPEARETVPQQ